MSACHVFPPFGGEVCGGLTSSNRRNKENYMKLPRTKSQEVVNLLFGWGRYRVTEDSLVELNLHLSKVLPKVIGVEYATAVLDYMQGKQLGGVVKQRKFHVMQILPDAIVLYPEAEPKFLPRVIYPKDKQWSLADLAEALFGEKGDPKVYHLDLPAPEGRNYTTEEVLRIVESLN